METSIASAGWIIALICAAAVGSGLVAGVFFAFSSFVMRALSRIPADQGTAAMRAINVAVLNSLFMLAFFATAALSLALLGVSFMRWGAPGATALLAGSVLYLAGVFGVTLIRNVPLNKALAAADPQSVSSGGAWRRYAGPWTAWNHLRTLMSLAASIAFAVALMR